MAGETNPEAEFRDWAERLKQGEDQAYRDLLRRYAMRLKSLASARIAPQFRAKFDTEDVVQSVLRSFCTNLQMRPTELESSQAMRGLLALMIKRKCAQYVQTYQAAKRNVNREIAGNWVESDVTTSREPSPQDSVQRADELAHCLQVFDDLDRQVAQAILDGESTACIAARLGTSQRTVQRTLRRICLRLSGDK